MPAAEASEPVADTGIARALAGRAGVVVYVLNPTKTGGGGGRRSPHGAQLEHPQSLAAPSDAPVRNERALPRSQPDYEGERSQQRGQGRQQRGRGDTLARSDRLP